MRILDSQSDRLAAQVQLYLSANEARELIASLNKLVGDPEAIDHFHLFSEDGGSELSCSIVTARKLTAGGYTTAEREAMSGWKPRA